MKISRNGRPVTGADVVVTFEMLDMEMGNQANRLTETGPGTYSRSRTPALVMVGHRGLSFDVTPRGGTAFNVLHVDRANG